VLEHKTPAGRLDVAVFNDDWTELTAIVEVKNGPLFFTNQIRKYKTIGVPVFGLNKLARCAHLAAQIKHNHPRGIPLRQVEKMRVIVRSGRRCIGERNYEFTCKGAAT